MIGGFASTGIATLPTELDAALQTEKMRSKIAKLVASGYSERHLFLLVRPEAFSFPVYNEMAADNTP